MQYDLEYFINKFDAIPEEAYSSTHDELPSDAWEWCDQDEANDLFRIVHRYGILSDVNDGEGKYLSYGDTEKQRVLRFLNYIMDEKKRYFLS